MGAVTSDNRSSSLLTDEAPPDPKAHGPFAAIRRVLPKGEVIRFLMVGVSNTVSSLAILLRVCDSVWAPAAAQQ
jgi:hypothetical protein